MFKLYIRWNREGHTWNGCYINYINVSVVVDIGCRDVLIRRAVWNKRRGINVMKSLSVIPHVGISPLILGMPPEQIISAIYQIHSELSLPDIGEFRFRKIKKVTNFP